MPTFSAGNYVEPGAYVSIKDVVIPNTPAGGLTGAFTGTGILTKIISETVILTRATTSAQLTGTVSTAPLLSWPTDDDVLIVVKDINGDSRH